MKTQTTKLFTIALGAASMALTAGVVFSVGKGNSDVLKGNATSQRTITFDNTGAIHAISGKTKYSISATSDAGNVFYMIVNGNTNYDASSDYIAGLVGSNPLGSTNIKFAKDQDGVYGLKFQSLVSMRISVYNTSSFNKAFYVYTTSNDGIDFDKDGDRTDITCKANINTGTGNLKNEDNYVEVVYASTSSTSYAYITSISITYSC